MSADGEKYASARVGLLQFEFQGLPGHAHHRRVQQFRYDAGALGFIEILANPPKAFLEATGQYTDEEDD
mgnify:CR=1 FL=1